MSHYELANSCVKICAQYERTPLSRSLEKEITAGHDWALSQYFRAPSGPDCDGGTRITDGAVALKCVTRPLQFVWIPNIVLIREADEIELLGRLVVYECNEVLCGRARRNVGHG